MKKKIWECLAWIPSILVVLGIFLLSSQSGEDSKSTSEGILCYLADRTRLEVDFNDIEHLASFDAWNQVIRTLAHMTEYAVLSLCVGLAVSVNGFRGKLRFIYMCLGGIGICILDEFYQIFVPGRYGDLFDVFIDSCSVVVMAGLLFWLGERKKAANVVPIYGRRLFMSSYMDSITLEEVLARFKQWLGEEEFHYIVTPNVDHMVKLEKDKEFRKIYEQADLILPDGAPLMWIADSLGNPLGERIPGSDLLPHVCELAAAEGKSLFLLGAGEGVADLAAANLQRDYPGLQIAGTYSPSMSFAEDKGEQAYCVSLVKEKMPDILVLALGSPKQERFMAAYQKELPVKLVLPIGAAVDFYAGTVRRAPAWMREKGLEWLFRFWQEPGRLFRRYFIEDMKIFCLAWKYRHQIRGEKGDNS